MLQTNQSKQQLFLPHKDVVQQPVHPYDDYKTMSTNEERILIHIKQADKTTDVYIKKENKTFIIQFFADCSKFIDSWTFVDLII